MVQQGESVLFWGLAAGTTITVGSGALLAGCLLLKAGGLAIFALASVRY